VQSKVTLVAKAILQGDLANGHITPAQLHGRAFHAAANQILVRRHTHRFSKLRFKM
jgi:hypothetical protein